MWYKEIKMLKEPETVAVQLAIIVPMIYVMTVEEAKRQNKRDMLIDDWLAREQLKLTYVV